MDSETLGAALAIARTIPNTAVGDAVAAANRAETSASSVEQSAHAIQEFTNTGLTVVDGKLCVKVERS